MARAGDLDRRVTIQTLTVTYDAYGGEVETWVDTRTESTKIHWQRGNERRQNAIERSHIPATFVFRDSALTRGLSPNRNRLVFENNTYDIHSAIPMGRGRMIEVEAIRRID